jgi:hypothetical protein
MDAQSNSSNFDMQWFRRGEYLVELETRYDLFSHPGKLRTIGWVNSGFMGSYREALDNSALNLDIVQTRRRRIKYGYVASIQFTDNSLFVTFFGENVWTDDPYNGPRVYYAHRLRFRLCDCRPLSHALRALRSTHRVQPRQQPRCELGTMGQHRKAILSKSTSWTGPTPDFPILRRPLPCVFIGIVRSGLEPAVGQFILYRFGARRSRRSDLNLAPPRHPG